MPRRSHPSQKIASLKFDDVRIARELFGAQDANLGLLEKRLGLEVNARGLDVKISGSEAHVEIAERVLLQLYALLKKGYPVGGTDVGQSISLLSRDRNADISRLFDSSVILPARRRAIMPRTSGQKAYLEAIKNHDVTFSIGPAGTGKSYLAVAMGVASLMRKECTRIILARPAVEAGEKLGFLPGTLVEKINPYLRPLYDALHDMIDPERVEEMIEDDVIEIAPLAFMRGRTLHRSFIILDEAQNSSYHQMKMCLTRLGTESKMVINGDVTQIDLPPGISSGLVEAWRILKDCPGIAFHKFTEADVVRHSLVKEIVTAYDKEEAKNG